MRLGVVAYAQELWSDYQDDADACALAGLALLGQLQSVGNYATNDVVSRVQLT